MVLYQLLNARDHLRLPVMSAALLALCACVPESRLDLPPAPAGAKSVFLVVKGEAGSRVYAADLREGETFEVPPLRFEGTRDAEISFLGCGLADLGVENGGTPFASSDSPVWAEVETGYEIQLDSPRDPPPPVTPVESLSGTIGASATEWLETDDSVDLGLMDPCMRYREIDRHALGPVGKPTWMLYEGNDSVFVGSGSAPFVLATTATAHAREGALTLLDLVKSDDQFVGFQAAGETIEIYTGSSPDVLGEDDPIAIDPDNTSIAAVGSTTTFDVLAVHGNGKYLRLHPDPEEDIVPLEHECFADLPLVPIAATPRGFVTGAPGCDSLVVFDPTPRTIAHGLPSGPSGLAFDSDEHSLILASGHGVYALELDGSRDPTPLSSRSSKGASFNEGTLAVTSADPTSAGVLLRYRNAYQCFVGRSAEQVNAIALRNGLMVIEADKVDGETQYVLVVLSLDTCSGSRP